jgi:hypothetical protein
MNTPAPEFSTVNDVERALVALHAGAIALPDFLQQLLSEPVYILLDRQFAEGATWDTPANPLVLTNAQGQSLLAVFTAPGRTADWARRAPAFGFGLRIESMRWLLGRMQAGSGIAINPGWPVALELSAGDAAQMQHWAAQVP